MILTKDAVKLTLPDSDVFSPDKSFNCGQCFRFEQKADSWQGVVKNTLLVFPKNQEKGFVTGFGADEGVIANFLDTKTSYTEIGKNILSSFSGADRELLEKAALVSQGMRILRQDFWEALISFIISQNNNIPRIKKNVQTICEKFGERISDSLYAFPTPEALLFAGKTGLDECRLGFRTKYILDAAEKIVSGEICEEELFEKSTEEAKQTLKTIHGVGEKVASCVLLYGLGRHSAVPVDVWMKKIFRKYFNKDTVDLGEWGGIAQQYLFFLERFIIEGKKV